MAASHHSRSTPASPASVSSSAPGCWPSSATTRTDTTLIWDRQRAVLRMRSALREFYPAALQAFPELTASDALVTGDRPVVDTI